MPGNQTPRPRPGPHPRHCAVAPRRIADRLHPHRRVVRPDRQFLRPEQRRTLLPPPVQPRQPPEARRVHRRRVIIKILHLRRRPPVRLQQLQQPPQVILVRLHRRGRQQQQPRRTPRQGLQQLQKLVGPWLATAAVIAGVVRFINDDQVILRVIRQEPLPVPA